MQIAENSYPRPNQQLPLPHPEQLSSPPPQPPQPPQFGLAQSLSPVLEPSSEQMQYDPFLSQYRKLQLQPLPSSQVPGSPPPLSSQLQQQAPQPPAAPPPLPFSYQTGELSGATPPEPDYPPACQYSMDPAQQSNVALPDCPRSSGPRESPSNYDPLALSELPGLFDCEMMEAVDPQPSGYVLVN